MVALGEDAAVPGGVSASKRPPLRRRLFAGGVYGNRELTAATGALILILMAALAVTVIAIGPLLGAHMFLGMVLLAPVALKLGSVSYRFTQYYAGNASYRKRGLPEMVMLVLGPLVVITTVIVFASGVVLLLAGPSSRGVWNPIHKISFGIWLAVWWGHVILHVPDLPKLWQARRRERERPWDDLGSGRGGRALSLAAALVLGAIIAILTLPLFGAWTHWQHLH